MADRPPLIAAAECATQGSGHRPLRPRRKRAKEDSMKRSILAAAIVATVVGGGSATAAKFITGSDIKDGTITARDIREGGITLNRLTPGAQALLRNHANSFTGNSQSVAVK